MKNHSIAFAIFIFVCIIVGMFVFAFIKKSELASTPSVPPPTSEATSTPYDSITHIDAKHFYINGVHTVAGEILMPTPCDLLNWDTRVAESMPEQATIAFTVVNRADTCAQTVTPMRFKAEFTASEQASIRATLMGREVTLNLIPPGPGETPEDFEVYIKG